MSSFQRYNTIYMKFIVLNLNYIYTYCLAQAILDSAQAILNITGSIIVAATVNPYFLIPVAVMSLIFIFVRKVYLDTSTNIKRLEGIGETLVFFY